MAKKLSKSTRDLLMKVSTATLCTALYKVGLRNQFIQDVHSFSPKGRNMVGQAYTLRYIPAREDLNPISVFQDKNHPQRVGVEECPKGHVMVIDSRKDPRAASAGGTLDVRAWSAHAAMGYSFAAPWSPRLSGQLVYASGDNDPADADWNRFNPLFGGRRGDFGTTGLSFTHFRENLIAFGPRLDLRNGPAAITLQLQESWLASDTDRWRVANLRDASGQSGDRIGTLAEARMTYWLSPDRLQLETGHGSAPG